MFKRSLIASVLIIMLVMAGCGGSKTQTTTPNTVDQGVQNLNQATEDTQAKTCQANQRNYETAADVFASETGSYPDAATKAAGWVGPTGTSSRVWPDGYFQGKLDAATHMPLCPDGGTISNTLAFGQAIRPLLTCSIASHQR